MTTPSASTPQPSPPPSASRFGRYVIIDTVGMGGMGVVYRAYDPKLDRKVAVKLLLPGRASRQERLVREAKAMARMSHPNVVPIHDVGEIDGHIFIAMDFVDGQTLTDWLRSCDRSPLEIMSIFRGAAAGLSAAHEVGVVHRDFKPDNVLVDGKGRPQVTDFGVAADVPTATTEDQRAKPPLSGESSKLTREGAIVGTPAYMAPEQFEGTTADERSDQFSFCIALWEALWKQRPFAGATPGDLSWAVINGKIIHPIRPAPKWIYEVLLRGLSTDPAKRWPSMTELLAALDHARGRASRRRLAYGVAAAFAIAGGVGVGLQYDHSRKISQCETSGNGISEVWNERARSDLQHALLSTSIPYASTTFEKMAPWIDRWSEQWSDLRTKVCIQAEVEDSISPELYRLSKACFDDRMNELVVLLAVYHTAEAPDVQNAVRAAARLSSLALCLNHEFLERQPFLREQHKSGRTDGYTSHAEVLRAKALEAAGRYSDAYRVADAALTRALDDNDVPSTAEARYMAGRLAGWLGNFDVAEQLLIRAFVDGGAIGADDIAARSAAELAYTTGFEGVKSEQGLMWADVGEMLVRRMGQADAPLGAELLTSRGSVHQARGEYDLACAAHERAIEIFRRDLGEEHPNVAFTLNNLGNALNVGGHAEKAIPVFLRAINIAEGTLGVTHPLLGTLYMNLCGAQDYLGAYEDSLQACEHALDIHRNSLPPGDPNVAISLANLAGVKVSLGHYDEALAVYAEALSVGENAWGPEHPRLAQFHQNYSIALRRAGRLDEAEEQIRRAIVLDERHAGLEHPDYGMDLNALGLLQMERGNLAEARTAFTRAQSIFQNAFGSESNEVADALGNLAMLESKTGAPERARDDFEQALAIKTAKLGPDHEDVGALYVELGIHSLRQGRIVESRELWERGLSIQVEKLGKEHRSVADSMRRVGLALRGGGYGGEASDYLQKCLKIYEMLLNPENPQLARFRAEVRGK